ncbi:MAG TPA: single-stranded-DNA-specific exonuclease RecJ [Candidatus Dojkabacteria bacterium]|nr:single-stranded-DNA-specific exonuclease RecJ [Candidatus Dojkabacteria bacterium]
MTYESSKKWLMPKEVPQKLLKSVYKDMDNITSTLLFNRDIDSKEKISNYFDATLEDIPHFSKLYDTARAVNIISEAINNDKKIFIHGDFDVDGICACAIIWEIIYKRIAKKIGKKIDVVPYIPDRVDEGYGLTEKSVNAMISQGAQLIISVDCGIRDKQIIEKYQKEGELDFVITDHHQLPDDFELSEKYVIVHPAIPDHEYPFTNICGAFVAFLLSMALAYHYNLTEKTSGDEASDEIVYESRNISDETSKEEISLDSKSISIEQTEILSKGSPDEMTDKKTHIKSLEISVEESIIISNNKVNAESNEFVGSELQNNEKIDFKSISDVSKFIDGLDLVALATVTDMMPLTDINRIIVKEGLKIINSGSRIAFVALSEVASVKIETIDSYHLGFVIGPRLNASGRIGSAMDALRLLVTENYQYAMKNAFELNTLNIKRQSMTEEALQQAKQQLDEKGYLSKDNKLLFVIGEGWSEGIVGLVAGKLTEFFSKPSIVVTRNNNECRGSARSIAGFNITEAIEEFAPRLSRYGGHAQAAGFSTDGENLPIFEKEIVEYANKKLENIDLQPELQIDIIVNSDDLNPGFPDNLQKFKPYGYGNRKPNIMIAKAVILEKRIMGNMQNHLKLVLKDSGFETVNAVMFDCKEDIEKLNIDDVINIVGSVEINAWNGNVDVQFMIKEWSRAEIDK